MRPNEQPKRARSNYQFARWFLALAALFLVIQTVFSFFFSTPSVKMTFHDTYFVVSQSWLFMLFAAQMLFIAVVYFMFGYMNRALHRGLSKVHFYVTLVAFGILLLGLWKVGFFTISDSEDVNAVLFDYNLLLKFLNTAAFTLLFAQIIFVINCLKALFSCKTSN